MIGQGPSIVQQDSAAVAGGPLASLANGAGDQILEMNPGGTAPAWYTIAGDGSMSAGVFRLLAIGSSALASLPVTVPILRWLGSVVSPTIAQDAPLAAGGVPTSMRFQAAPPNAGSTTNASNTPGGFSFELAAPGVTGVAGSEAYWVLKRAGSEILRLGTGYGSGGGLSYSSGFTNLFAQNGVIIHGNNINYIDGGFILRDNSGATTGGQWTSASGLQVANASVTPTSIAGVACSYGKSGGMACKGSGGATTIYAGGGQGTKNTHAFVDSADVGVCTVTVAGVGATLYQWTVPAGSMGLLRADVCARMVAFGSTALGHVGDGQTVTLSFGYSNVVGVGITLTALASTVVQTIGTPGAIAYAISASGNVITLQVTDSYAGTGAWSIDHQCNTHLSAN